MADYLGQLQIYVDEAAESKEGDDSTITVSFDELNWAVSEIMRLREVIDDLHKVSI